ncbi:hypothetical protein SERLA73DRAFT_92151 [Serpula lacrymans var. lacrymans S7.3]|uniref:GTP-binding protein 2 n=2 Tax=Serpula lacrymans var. lacrymans TaxID=341189 RepID=F8Q1T4_SERL3|nr:uncharacterized protein SERLADRAFT_416385 [Serpula lacrymans var. lacrymans S7.9]EGN97145.1 hypothetical protein SERLA73DRAFT_92151 [Serpula lacrymans var. lacrymans S7.3]EGO22754.1 hypothetical protein SERLADRAFT_416385 [Serpula lacrymans var. lacrymans S7.9]
MFGESESESPRVPSPWDSLISTPPSPPRERETLQRNIPKLVPEAEEGNVEYKLQLLSPSPARFARLVTQLKWRLLEGGGQAYYELGVADSGALVGLPRIQLEESLETLEMMAGEIGASVIVVKEVEVPAELADSNGSPGDRWGIKHRRERESLMLSVEDDSATSTTDADFETDLSTTDVTDVDDDPISPQKPRSDAEAKNKSADDSLLAIFTMDAESEVEVLDGVGGSVCDPAPFSVNLEIASVYKPRPMRRRAHIACTGTTMATSPQTKHDKRMVNTKTKKAPHHVHQLAPPHSTDITNGAQAKQQPKALNRRFGRDRRRDAKRVALLTHVPTERAGPLAGVEGHEREGQVVDEISAGLVARLESLHVTVEPQSVDSTLPPELLVCASGVDRESMHSPPVSYAREGVNSTVGEETGGTRLIVEALVVRKLSLEEAYLDFGGFSLL